MTWFFPVPRIGRTPVPNLNNHVLGKRTAGSSMKHATADRKKAHGSIESLASLPFSSGSNLGAPLAMIKTKPTSVPFGDGSCFSIQNCVARIAPNNSDLTLSEIDFLRSSLIKVKDELSRTRKKYLAEKAQAANKDKSLRQLTAQFNGLLKVLEENDEDVKQLLRKSNGLYEKDDKFNWDAECQRDLALQPHMSTDEEAKQKETQDIMAELETLRQEVKIRRAEVMKMLEERASERNQKENEVRKLKIEVASLKFQVLESQAARMRNTFGDDRALIETPVVTKGEGGRENDESSDADVETREAEGTKKNPECSIPRQLAAKKELIAEWERTRKDCREQVRKRESVLIAKYIRATSVSSVGNSYNASCNTLKSKHYSSPTKKGRMEPIREFHQREYRHRHGQESVAAFYERLHKTKTESIAMKRST